MGKVERLAWGGLGVGREADGRLVLLSAPMALFPGEEVEAEVRWKARHGEGDVLEHTRRVCEALVSFDEWRKLWPRKCRS